MNLLQVGFPSHWIMAADIEIALSVHISNSIQAILCYLQTIFVNLLHQHVSSRRTYVELSTVLKGFFSFQELALKYQMVFWASKIAWKVF